MILFYDLVKWDTFRIFIQTSNLCKYIYTCAHTVGTLLPSAWHISAHDNKEEMCVCVRVGFKNECVHSHFPVWQTACSKWCLKISITKRQGVKNVKCINKCMNVLFILSSVSVSQPNFRQPFQIKSHILPSTQTAARLKNKWFCCRCHLTLMHSLGGGHLAVSTISAFIWHSFNITGGSSEIKNMPQRPRFCHSKRFPYCGI